MARFFHARHGRTHCPGGSDPIPCLPGQWAALYSGAVVWGQPVTEGVFEELHFPASDQSDASTDIFQFIEQTDPDLIMPQIFKLELQRSGVYSFDLSVFYLDASFPEAQCGYSISRLSGGSMLVPGDISQPFLNFHMYRQTYRNLSNFASWDHFDGVAWSPTPILITSPVVIRAGLTYLARDSNGNSGVFETNVDSKLMVAYHGPLAHAAAQFNAQDG